MNVDAMEEDIRYTRFHIVGDPFHKVGGNLALNNHHLPIHLFGARLASKHYRCNKIPAMIWICSTHHVIGMSHL